MQTRGTPQIEDKLRWRKILYSDQGVPDNYTDPSFLDEMRKNVNTQTYSYWNVVIESLMVTGQLCSLCIFVVVYVHMLNGGLPPRTLLYTIGSTTVIGYVVDKVLLANLSATDEHNECSDAAQTSKRSNKHWTVGVAAAAVSVGARMRCGKHMSSGATLLVSTWFLSPVLHTLTDTISTDTVYAMVTVMLAVNLLLTNHPRLTHAAGHEENIVRQAVSLNVVIFAAVCLASRLPTTQHTHALISLVIQLFALWPHLRHHISEYSRSAYIVTSIVANLGTVVLMLSVSAVGTSLLTLSILLITFVAPAYLIYLQPLKDTVHGPWDEAEIRCEQ